MSSTAEAAARATTDGGRSRFTRGRRIVAALAITQTIGYGVLYYAFSVFLAPMGHELRASDTQLALALTLSVLTAALCSPLVGRLLDIRGGRGLMTAGSVLGLLAVLTWSRVTNLSQLYVVFVAIGIASAMVLYEPAFAVVVSWFDAKSRGGALLAITIVAGFASSIFLPLSGLLVQRYGWRQALVILALLYGGSAIPLHALILRRRARPAGEKHAPTEIVRMAVRERPFWLLAGAFSAHAGAVAAVTVLLITYLIHLGHRPIFAATIAGLLGMLSVTGRLVTTGLQRRLSAAPIAAAIFGLQAVAALLLPLVGAGAPGAVGCVLLFGLGFGIDAVTQPHLIAARYGTTAYASLAGRIALFSITSRATAPLGAVALAQLIGYGPVLVAVAATCVIAAFALVAYHRVSFR